MGAVGDEIRNRMYGNREFTSEVTRMECFVLVHALGIASDQFREFARINLAESGSDEEYGQRAEIADRLKKEFEIFGMEG